MPKLASDSHVVGVYWCRGRLRDRLPCMWPHRDVWLLIIALVLAFPVSMLANMFTPLFLNWFAKRTWASLNKRIAKLEAKLAKFEKHPAITEVEDHILWGLRSLHIRIMGVAGTLLLGLVFAVGTLSDFKSQRFYTFEGIVLLVCGFGLVSQLFTRYAHDFRYYGSPRNRKGLRTAIEDLKKIRDNWSAPK